MTHDNKSGGIQLFLRGNTSTESGDIQLFLAENQDVPLPLVENQDVPLPLAENQDVPLLPNLAVVTSRQRRMMDRRFI